ncbi:uncharacterized protein LOC106641189 isoform X2 [Copidosoma floridanum]|uniref:uncharacterized protein LOC106641189 isoform X2 n=1 Tax=Copidosoma floridanum TaxID=29053 RepID=UPI0006C9DD8D|nr:uncharacterized protein LOC106641189 isoform X2 [Copidosoma floridanum]
MQTNLPIYVYFEKGKSHILKTMPTVDSDVEYRVEYVMDSEPQVQKKIKRSREDKAWSDWDEVLIASVQKHPCIWNHDTSPKIRSFTSLQEAWEDVAQDLEGTFDPDTVKKRWRNLRDSYNKARKKALASIPSDSEASHTNLKSSFRHYEVMSFLTDTQTKNKSSIIVQSPASTVDEMPNLSGTISSSGSYPNESRKLISEKTLRVKPTSSTISQMRGQKRSHQEPDFAELIRVIEKTNKQIDDIEGFSVHLTGIMRRLPYKSRRRLEIDIMELASKAEEEAGLI